MMVTEERKSKYVSLLLLVGLLLFFLIVIGVFSRPLRASFRPLVRNIENKFVSYKTYDYSYIESQHFLIRYEKGVDRDFVDLMGDKAEDKYKRLREYFDYKPRKKILIIIYNRPESLMEVAMLGEDTVPMGAYFGDALHILATEGVVLHELAHLFTDHLGGGNFPPWFTEGVSLYFEDRIDGYEWGKDVVLQADEYSAEDLTKNFYQMEEYLAYTQSYRLVKGLVDREGVDRLVDIIRDLGKGRDIGEYFHLFNN